MVPTSMAAMMEWLSLMCTDKFFPRKKPGGSTGWTDGRRKGWTDERTNRTNNADLYVAHVD